MDNENFTPNNQNFNMGSDPNNGYQNYDQNMNQGYNQNMNQGYDQNYNQAYNQNDYGTVYNAVPVSNGKGFSIASMVCGICSIVFCWCYGVVGLVLGIVAVVLAIKAKSLNGEFPNGMAKAGLICGIIGAVLSAIMIVLVVMSIVTTGVMSGLGSLRYYL